MLRYETEQFIRCCDIPPKVQCCQCENGISSIWEIQDSLAGMYSNEISPGFKQAWGCERFANDGVRRLVHSLGPFYPGEPQRTGECHWTSVDPQPGRCCQFGCEETGGFGNDTSVYGYMSCRVSAEVPEVPPVMGWWLDCACDDLWVGDSSEWGSLEDCLEFDTNCQCSNDEGAFSNTLDDCNYLKAYYEGMGITCGECEEREMIPGSPGYPAYVSHSAGIWGPCGCGRSYVLLNPLDPLCKDMLDSVDSSNLQPFDCEGCNTYVLVQYVGTMVDGSPAPGYPCGLGASHICNGADAGCTDCCEGLGYYYCLGYPATLTLCPAESINPPSSDSDCNPDVLCCEEVLGQSVEAQSITAPPTPPEDSLHFSFLGTSTTGYLKKDVDGIYRGGDPPIKLEVNRIEQTLNGRKMTMFSDDPFIGHARIGGEQIYFTVEIMACVKQQLQQTVPLRQYKVQTSTNLGHCKQMAHSRNCPSNYTSMQLPNVSEQMLKEQDSGRRSTKPTSEP